MKQGVSLLLLLLLAGCDGSGWYDVEEDGIVLTVRPKGEDSGAALRFSFEDGSGESYVHIDLAAE